MVAGCFEQAAEAWEAGDPDEMSGMMPSLLSLMSEGTSLVAKHLEETRMGLRQKVEKTTIENKSECKEVKKSEAEVETTKTAPETKAETPVVTMRYNKADVVGNVGVEEMSPHTAVRLLITYKKFPKLIHDSRDGTALEEKKETEIDFTIVDSDEISQVVKEIEERKHSQN